LPFRAEYRDLVGCLLPFRAEERGFIRRLLQLGAECCGFIDPKKAAKHGFGSVNLTVEAPPIFQTPPLPVFLRFAEQTLVGRGHPSRQNAITGC
jgi:hypothetical protein